VEAKHAANNMFEDISFRKNKIVLLNIQTPTKNALYFYKALFSKKKLN
jgi:hypothetical protein